MATIHNKGGERKKRAFALFAVMLMLATAFAGLTFIGSTMIDEDTSAGGGSSSSPLDSLSMGILDADGTYYVKVGGTVNVTPNPQSGGMHVNSVTSGYGLSCTTNGGTAKTLSGTISKAGTITCTVTNFAGTTSYSSFKIVGVVSEHTIQFNRGTHGSITYGGSTSQNMTVPDGTSCTISGASLTISGYGTVTGSGQSGYEAYGWSYTGGSGTATSGSFTITQNTTISLATRTVTSYTVTISAGTGGSVSKTSVSVPSGTSISTSGSTLTIGSNTITATANSGYSFSSWSNASGTVTANRTITANFSQNSYTCYLYYDANGGSGAPSTQSYTGTSTSNHSFTVSSTTPTKSGYTFLGWSTSPSATSASYSGGSSISVGYNSSKTLYAVWQQNTTYYSKLFYDANGGSGAPSTQSVSGSYSSNPGSYSHTISSTVPTRSGYTFLGWSTNSSATSPSYNGGNSISVSYSTSSSSGTTLYAVWQQNYITVGSVAQQYAVAGSSVTFTASATSSPSGASVSFAKSNISSGLTVTISGSSVTCSSSSVGTYTFTLTGSASGYASGSTTVTVTFVPQLQFSNTPSAGQLAS